MSIWPTVAVAKAVQCSYAPLANATVLAGRVINTTADLKTEERRFEIDANSVILADQKDLSAAARNILNEIKIVSFVPNVLISFDLRTFPMQQEFLSRSTFIMASNDGETWNLTVLDIGYLGEMQTTGIWKGICRTVH